MAEQSFSWPTTYGWLSLLAAMTLAGSAVEDVDSLVAACPLPIGVLDLGARRLLVMSPALADLLEVGAAGDVDLEMLVEPPPSLGDLFDLVRGGAIDAYSVRRRLPRRTGPVEAESWVVVTGQDDRSRGLWLVVPSAVEPGAPVPELEPETWPSSMSGLVVGSFDAEWRLQRISVDVERVLGRGVDDMVGRPVTAEVRPEDVPALFAAAARCLLDEAAVGVSLSWRHRSGDWVRLHCIITRLVDDPLMFGFAGSVRSAGDDGQAGRVVALERHLWHIAREVELSGVVAGFGRVPDLDAVPGLSELSGRQWEILTRLLRGERVPAIAEALFVSQSTVRNHLTDMFRKLGVHSQAELLDLLRGDSPPPDGRPGPRQGDRQEVPPGTT